MTVYNLIKDYQLPLLLLRKVGYVGSSLARDLKIYEEYISLEGTKTQRQDMLGEKYRLSPRTIRTIISTLNSRA